MKWRAFTPEERVELERLIKQGVSQAQIAIILKRAPSSICNEVKKGGGVINYTALAAQEEKLRQKAIQREKMRAWFRENKPVLLSPKMKYEKRKCATRRLDAIERQLEILFKLIKEKTKTGG